MGQVQSDEAPAPAAAQNSQHPTPSKDSLIAAMMRNGACGDQFSAAFLCFLKSTAEEKGSDCVNPFVALQNCIKANPNAFPKEISVEEEPKKEEALTEEYKIIPPVVVPRLSFRRNFLNVYVKVLEIFAGKDWLLIICLFVVFEKINKGLYVTGLASFFSLYCLENIYKVCSNVTLNWKY